MFRVKHLNNEHRKKKTMQTLLGAQYRQTLLFGDVNLNLNPGGIVTVSGKNLNVRRTGVEYDTNAVGKSVLFSSLANVLYERGALHESAKSKKELYGDAWVLAESTTARKTVWSIATNKRSPASTWFTKTGNR